MGSHNQKIRQQMTGNQNTTSRRPPCRLISMICSSTPPHSRGQARQHATYFRNHCSFVSTLLTNMSRRRISMIISSHHHLHSACTLSPPASNYPTASALMCASAQPTHTPITTFRPGPHGLCPRHAFTRHPPAAFRPGPRGLCPRHAFARHPPAAFRPGHHGLCPRHAFARRPAVAPIRPGHHHTNIAITSSGQHAHQQATTSTSPQPQDSMP